MNQMMRLKTRTNEEMLDSETQDETDETVYSDLV